jgi:hypothetical protein
MTEFMGLVRLVLFRVVLFSIPAKKSELTNTSSLHIRYMVNMMPRRVREQEGGEGSSLEVRACTQL